MHNLLLKRIHKTKADVPVTLRTYQDEVKYAKAKARGELIPLHLEPRLREWKHWMIIDNKFPYSALFKTHHMLLPKRVTKEDDLTPVEVKELRLIFKELDTTGDYDCRMVNFVKKQSILSHFHIHLLCYKDERF